MRLRKADFRQRINGNLHIEISKESITSYSGLELLGRYLRRIDLPGLIRRTFAGHPFGGDFSPVEHIRTLMSLWLTGGRKLCHLAYIASDPLTKRFCGLHRLPSDRTVSSWLKQFRNASLAKLKELNSAIVMGKLYHLALSRLTLDVDGTPITCGNKVAWAFRGYNPHQRYAKSYYPILCHVAQTGHMLRVQNRPGNVHDSKGGALRVIREAVGEIRKRHGGLPLEMRLDSAFFNNEVVGYLFSHGIEYAIKVPMWEKAGFKSLIREQEKWRRAGNRLWYFVQDLQLSKWKFPVRLTFYRRKISDHTPSGYQYDLFSPNDGIYEYFIIATNKTIGAKTLFEFYNGRSAMEAQIAELKGEFGFDSVPTDHYQANSAYQQLSILAYNLVRNFQLDTGIAKPRTKSRKRTGLFSFDSLKTLRFKLIGIGGRIIKREYGNVLRINECSKTNNLYSDIEQRLAA